MSRVMLAICVIVGVTIFVGTANAATECYSCDFFNDLGTIKETFTFKVFNSIGPKMRPVFSKALVLYFSIIGGLILLNPSSLMQRLNGAVKVALWSIPTTAALMPSGANNAPLVYSWVVQPIEQGGLEYGAEILKFSGGGELFTAHANAANDYAGLASMVEAQVFKVFDACRAIIQLASAGGITEIGWTMAAIVGTMILMLPYIFVLGVFFAFMVEAMFKVVAMGITAPLLVAFVPFPALRPFPTSGLRILFGAALTIAFASGAMGFSMMAVDKYVAKLVTIHANTIGKAPSKSEAQACFQAANKKWADNPPENPTQQAAHDKDYAACQAMQDQANAADKNAASQKDVLQKFLFGGDYIILVILGFASILLHLQAKSLASNISGANDGAGPAAATVAAGKMALGGAAYAGLSAGLGSKGLSGLLPGNFGGSIDPGAGALARFSLGMQQHGAIGGLAAQFLPGGGANQQMSVPDWAKPSQSSGYGGGGQYSGGGDHMAKAMERQTQLLEQLVKATRIR